MTEPSIFYRPGKIHFCGFYTAVFALTLILPACNHGLHSGAMQTGLSGRTGRKGVAGDCNSLAETHAWFDSQGRPPNFILKIILLKL